MFSKYLYYRIEADIFSVTYVISGIIDICEKRHYIAFYLFAAEELSLSRSLISKSKLDYIIPLSVSNVFSEGVIF